MIEKTPLCPQRLRKITGSFAFIEHRFLRDGFFESLTHHELLLYLFLVLVADRRGLSYYSYDKICTLLRISVDEYLCARDALIQKDVLAFDGHLYQVLCLPQKPLVQRASPLKTRKDMAQRDPATIGQIVRDALGGTYD
ncbi:MAG: hypothetical protein JW883_17295 [Deltaproteobacteria bacterium]|nr:hypothetical protein [Deltaproteobacteria bacterium]